MIQPLDAPENRAQGLLPPGFEPEYVDSAVKPFSMSATYIGNRPVLPMIDLAISKNLAVPPHIRRVRKRKKGPLDLSGPSLGRKRPKGLRDLDGIMASHCANLNHDSVFRMISTNFKHPETT